MRRVIVVRTVALITFGSGVMNLLSLLFPLVRDRASALDEVFPIEFRHVSKFLTLLAGFALVVTSIQILRRKQRAFHLALALSVLSVLFHLTKGLNYEEAALSSVLLVALVFARREFTVESGSPGLGAALLQFALVSLIVYAYGAVGFWSLDVRDFGINFRLGDALRMTFEYLTFRADPTIQPFSRHGEWFLHSLNLITITGAVYSAYVLYGPAVYRFSTLPRERALAGEIVRRYGRSALDYFKTWPDKSYVFSPSHETFVAYRVAAGHAIALADPVGPEGEIEDTIAHFRRFCDERDWRVAFHQALPDFLPLYQRQGFKRLKIGDDAIVDLEHFSLAGRPWKEIRHTVNRLEREGVVASWHDPPVPHDVVARVKEVSDEWLRFSGRRERRFTLGMFDPDYITHTPQFLVQDASGRVLAFANLVPSYCPGEATNDLMRRRTEAPNGVMDFLFVKLFLECRQRGFRRFNFGMSPMSGIIGHDEASREERALHAFFQRLNFIFSYRGLKQYKAKYASAWEPRYLIYRNVLELPNFALALGVITERKD